MVCGPSSAHRYGLDEQGVTHSQLQPLVRRTNLVQTQVDARNQVLRSQCYNRAEEVGQYLYDLQPCRGALNALQGTSQSSIGDPDRIQGSVEVTGEQEMTLTSLHSSNKHPAGGHRETLWDRTPEH